MITPDAILKRAQCWWDDQTFLRNYLTINDFFAEPKSIGRIGHDNERDLLTNFTRIAEEQEALRRNSRDALGYGYTLHWQTKTKQNLGVVRLIGRITFESQTDWLRYVGRETDFARFVALVAHTRQHVPELEPWLLKYPLRLLEHADAWPDWLAICQYFRDDYVPDSLYVRQLPLPVHTKFLEEHSGLLLSLLGTICPTLLRPQHADWRRRLGLLVPEPMIRVRALDDRLRLAGQHPDFGLPLSAFVAWGSERLPRRVFLCENLLNFLTLPPQPGAMAIWSGGGFQIKCLEAVGWLATIDLLYWGDLDPHGFLILNQCRGYFPHTRALLMDRATFEAHRPLVGQGETTPITSLPHLTDDERDLFQLLNRNGWRIEQERLRMEWVLARLSE